MTLDISSAFCPARDEDHSNHAFPGAEWWQESALFTMCDPTHGVIGYYRIGMHPFLKQSNAYYWTAAHDLTLDDKQFRPGMPIIDTDVTSAAVAELRYQAVKPMEEYLITINRPNYRAEITWRPYFRPLMMRANVKGASFAAGHYNAVGHASGFIESDGRRIEVNADGSMDHSWGERKNHFPASKWIFAVFDEETFVHAFPVMSMDGAGRHLIGYVSSDGMLRKLTDRYETNFAIREDWMTPASCAFEVTDEDGREFRFTGKSSGPSSIYPFIHGKFCVHAVAAYEFRGRTGKGLLENSPPRAIPGTYIDRFGLSKGGIWLQGPDHRSSAAAAKV